MRLAGKLVFSNLCLFLRGFPDGSEGKESSCNVGDTGDLGLIPESGRYPGEGNGYPLQYSCLENRMDRGAWWAKVHGVTKSQTRLSDSTAVRLQSLSPSVALSPSFPTMLGHGERVSVSSQEGSPPPDLQHLDQTCHPPEL